MLVSQPSARLSLQSTVLEEQLNTHCPPEHDTPLAVGQLLPQAPQWLMLDRLLSQPSASCWLQFPKPAAHLSVHAPAEQ